jgi:hypothetical protein
VAWVAGLVGIAALGRWLARRSRRNAPQAVPEAPAADPAEELRRRLDETREGSAPAPGAPAAVEEQTIDERRAAVHRQAEDAIAAMRESGL